MGHINLDFPCFSKSATEDVHCSFRYQPFTSGSPHRLPMLISMHHSDLRVLPTILWFSISIHETQGASSCWFPNGAPAPVSLPCNLTESESACCARGLTCLSNGVCQIDQDLENANDKIGTMWRGSCTDRSWQSSDCPLFCYSAYSI